MKIYILNLLFISFISIINTRFNYYSEDNKLGKYKTNNFAVVVSIIMLSLVAGLRYDVGSDFLVYQNTFNRMINITFSEALFSKNEVFFNITTWIIMQITNNSQFVFMFYSIITIGLIVKSLKDYSSIFPLSLYLYITSMMYYSSFNGIRQWIAVAIVFYGYRYLTKNRKKFFVLIFIASLFHTSAIIMIPIYFIIKKDFFNKINFLIISFAIIFTLFFNRIFNQFIKILLLTPYSGYEKWFEKVDRGANIGRMIISIAPLILSLLNYKRLKKEVKNFNILMNFILLNSVTMLIATQNWIFARFASYFSIYNLILIPELLRIKNKNLKNIIFVSVVILYYIYMVLMLPRESDLIPYKTIMELKGL